MTRFGGAALLAAAALCSHGATRSLPIGDAARGQRVVHEKACLECHSVNRQGARRAPDLALAVKRGFSPYNLAALMWNHAPGMSAAWKSRGMARPQLTEQDAADLFAYFYSSRYFEGPGSARRGRDVFENKNCSRCHGVATSFRPDAPPVSQWGSVADPIALGSRLWNHSARMRQAMAKQGIEYPRLSPGELTDLLAYLRAQNGAQAAPREFAPGSPEKGRALLTGKGCLPCHQGARGLEERPTRYTLVDFVVGLWNHTVGPTAEARSLSREDLSDVLAYLLATQFSEERGDAVRGKRVYVSSRCVQCHDAPYNDAPRRSAMLGRMSSYAMIAAAWQHSATMQERMRAKRITWPNLDDQEMADLIAFLNGQRLKQRDGGRR